MLPFSITNLRFSDLDIPDVSDITLLTATCEISTSVQIYILLVVVVRVSVYQYKQGWFQFT